MDDDDDEDDDDYPHMELPTPKNCFPILYCAI